MPLPSPLLRHGRPPLVVAHRGSSATHPENTVPAFRAAWDSGATWLETDVQPSADDTPVLIHDDTVDRTTDGTGAVRALTDAQLRTLDAGSWFAPGAAGTRIPLLSELLAELPAAVHMLLEIKGDHTRAQLESVVTALERSQVHHRVVLQSFERPLLQILHRTRPDAPLGLLTGSIDDDPVATCRHHGAVTYNPGLALLLDRLELIDQLHRAGIAVICWTVNEPDHWQLLTDAGIDGMFTDRPADLLTWQAQRA